jgi:hypothetical protein
MVVRGRGFLCNGERAWIRILPLRRELASADVSLGGILCWLGRQCHLLGRHRHEPSHLWIGIGGSEPLGAAT